MSLSKIIKDTVKNLKMLRKIIFWPLTVLELIDKISDFTAEGFIDTVETFGAMLPPIVEIEDGILKIAFKPPNLNREIIF
jgi:hypothetical protein